MSIILVLFLLIGVAYSKHISFYSNTNGNVPIIRRQQERRICAELCMSGLGGEPCGGDTCLDITPEGLLKQRSSQSTSELKNASNTNVNLNNIVNQTTIKIVTKPPPSRGKIASARRGACPILCKNQLGYPLCGCNNNTTGFVSNNNNNNNKTLFKVDYFEICSYFCVTYNYKIFGCPDCAIFKTAYKFQQLVMQNIQIEDDHFDWNAWCGQQCHEGEGGAACNCDILPMLI